MLKLVLLYIQLKINRVQKEYLKVNEILLLQTQNLWIIIAHRLLISVLDCGQKRHREYPENILAAINQLRVQLLYSVDVD